MYVVTNTEGPLGCLRSESAFCGGCRILADSYSSAINPAWPSQFLAVTLHEVRKWATPILSLYAIVCFSHDSQVVKGMRVALTCS